MTDNPERDALRRIAKFGMDNPGHGYSCATMALDILSRTTDPRTPHFVTERAMALYFAHGCQQGFPNGLPTWDEMPEAERQYWRALAMAASDAVRGAK